MKSKLGRKESRSSLNEETRRGGWTLLEVLISASLILWLIPHVYFFLHQLRRSWVDAADQQKTLCFATQVLERLRQEPYDALQDGALGEGKGETQVVEIASGLKQVEVRASRKLGRPPFVLTTLMSNEIHE